MKGCDLSGLRGMEDGPRERGFGGERYEMGRDGSEGRIMSYMYVQYNTYI